MITLLDSSPTVTHSSHPYLTHPYPFLITPHSYFGPPVDVWAFACMAFQMLCCKPAFSAESLAALHVRILRCQLA